jgi:hypothetical protein
MAKKKTTTKEETTNIEKIMKELARMEDNVRNQGEFDLLKKIETFVCKLNDEKKQPPVLTMEYANQLEAAVNSLGLTEDGDVPRYVTLTIAVVALSTYTGLPCKLDVKVPKDFNPCQN